MQVQKTFVPLHHNENEKHKIMTTIQKKLREVEALRQRIEELKQEKNIVTLVSRKKEIENLIDGYFDMIDELLK